MPLYPPSQLRMVGRGPQLFDVLLLAQLLCELPHEYRGFIRQDLFWRSHSAKDLKHGFRNCRGFYFLQSYCLGILLFIHIGVNTCYHVLSLEAVPQCRTPSSGMVWILLEGIAVAISFAMLGHVTCLLMVILVRLLPKCPRTVIVKCVNLNTADHLELAELLCILIL